MLVDDKELFGKELHDFLKKRDAQFDHQISTGKMQAPSIFLNTVGCADLCKEEGSRRYRPAILIEKLMKKYDSELLMVFRELDIPVDLTASYIIDLDGYVIKLYTILLCASRCLNIDEIDYEVLRKCCGLSKNDFYMGIYELQNVYANGPFGDYPLVISKYSDVELIQLAEEEES